MRFPIRIDTIWAPFVLVGGATRANSYVEVNDGEVSFNYGMLFRHKIPLDDIEDVTPRDWPWWFGVGWRSNLRDLVGLIGSYDGVVEVKLRSKKRYWAVLGASRIAVSLENPEGFIESVKRGRSTGSRQDSDGAESKPKTKRKTSTRKAPTRRRKKVEEKE